MATSIQIMTVIGSAVPARLRAQGVLACWYLIRNGEALSGPLPDRRAALAMAAALESDSLLA